MGLYSSISSFRGTLAMLAKFSLTSLLARYAKSTDVS